MIKLEELHGDTGARQKRKRVGRGESSGLGKTCGRGHKGSQSRSGGSKGKSFEGGQTPLARRLPARGFSNKRWEATPLTVINVSDLNAFDDGAAVDFQVLVAARLARPRAGGVKVLGSGELKKKLTVTADRFSQSAREKIEAAGGSCEVGAPKPVENLSDDE